MKIQKYLKYLWSILIIVVPAKTLAFCPVCTAGVIAGVGLSRWLGIDDTITSLWIGALTVTLIYLTEKWLEKMNVRFKGRLIVDSIIYYVLILVPLMKWNITGHPHNKIFGVDKIIFGVFAGSIFFILGYYLDIWLKKTNKGKAYFPFQRVVAPILVLIIISVILYLITK